MIPGREIEKEPGCPTLSSTHLCLGAHRHVHPHTHVSHTNTQHATHIHTHLLKEKKAIYNIMHKTRINTDPLRIAHHIRVLALIWDIYRAHAPRLSGHHRREDIKDVKDFWI